jgi:hypothetical protein
MCYFQRMMKPRESVKYADLELRAIRAIEALLAETPVAHLVTLETSNLQPDIDILVHVDAFDQRYVLACQVNASGQPRAVRTSLLKLRDGISQFRNQVTPLLIAPYLSPESRALCKEQSVGYLDLEGNARLQFGGVFMDHRVASKPAVERRELRSLFKPKAAQVLRVMLREPYRRWRVAELAECAGVSLGHVSNIRNALLAREWASLAADGVFLSEPAALLDDWRAEYALPEGEYREFYTVLHGRSLEDAVREAVGIDPKAGRVIMAAFSAADWLAPYGRTGTQYFYADNGGIKRLQAALKLSTVPRGGNVIVTVPKDPGLFLDAIEPAAGVLCTSDVQTFLDLSQYGERGVEAADHLRDKRLDWSR